MIKTFFSPDGVSIDGIFMDINLGRYVNQVQFKDTVLSRSIRQKSDASEEATNPQKKYLDPLAEKDALEYTTVLFDEAIEIANKNLVHPILLAWSISMLVFEFLSINIILIKKRTPLFKAGQDHLHHILYKKNKNNQGYFNLHSFHLKGAIFILFLLERTLKTPPKTIIKAPNHINLIKGLWYILIDHTSSFIKLPRVIYKSLLKPGSIPASVIGMCGGLVNGDGTGQAMMVGGLGHQYPEMGKLLNAHDQIRTDYNFLKLNLDYNV